MRINIHGKSQKTSLTRKPYHTNLLPRIDIKVAAMNFLKQANASIKSAKELEKNLASVGITKKTFMGKKEEPIPSPVPAGTTEVPAHSK